MMDNFDRLVTDKRLNLSEIRNWLSDEKNQSKFYLEEFAPFLTAGSTGENAMVVYNRRSLDRVMAKIQARFPFDRQISIYRQVNTAASHLMGARARVAFLSVPRGTFFALVRHRPSVQRLVANRKLISVFDPIDRIVEQLNEFQPDRMISKYYLI
jgi:hypothetical protein